MKTLSTALGSLPLVDPPRHFHDRESHHGGPCGNSAGMSGTNERGVLVYRQTGAPHKQNSPARWPPAGKNRIPDLTRPSKKGREAQRELSPPPATRSGQAI